MAHTKAPWLIQMGPMGQRYIYSDSEAMPRIVCSDVRHFDMHLIAEAPNMLQLLEDFVAWAERTASWNKTEQLYYQARELIERAKKEC